MEKENNYFVVLQRYNPGTCLENRAMQDAISIYDREEAIQNNWIDENGNRIWVVPSQNERSHTFVWGFIDLERAVNFYDILQKNELGICVEEV